MVMANDSCVSILSVINTTINQLESNVSLLTTYCLFMYRAICCCLQGRNVASIGSSGS